MKTNQCPSSTVNRNNSMSTTYAQKPIGREIAKLEKELAELDQFENQLKNNMQDRMKFMGGKNAMKKSRDLNDVCKKQDSIRAQIARLQESV